MPNKFPLYTQLDTMDCGPTCLRMVAQFYGKNFSLDFLRERCYYTKQGVSIGLHTMGVAADSISLAEEQPLPAILFWQQSHFVVLYKIKRRRKKISFYIADPVGGKYELSHSEFESAFVCTVRNGKPKGFCLFFDTTPEFFENDDVYAQKEIHSLKFLYHYVKPYKNFFLNIFFGMVIGSILSLIFPFLTQDIVDIGIASSDVNFVYLILIAQLLIFLGQITIEFIRSRIVLHIGSRINISLVSDFLLKIMKLPMRFFDTKMTGDLLQRVNDYAYIKDFLTNQSFTTIFSVVNIFIFGIVLAIYNPKICILFFLLSLIYVLWIILFLKKRKELNYKEFLINSENQTSIMQLITGMQEIKINNCEQKKRWSWEQIQIKLFKVSLKTLTLDQYQSIGGGFINQVKNILITFFAAQSVINEEITLGMMLSVQFIIGQLNSPIDNIIGFIHSFQDAKIALERLNEVQKQKDEQPDSVEFTSKLSENKDIIITDLCFSYGNPNSAEVLKNINLTIPYGKTTAIVGFSGSGKTTLMKLLLGFYQPSIGNIKIGHDNLTTISPSFWRSQCGVVMQDGFIFNDTIAENIAASEAGTIDTKRLRYAAQTACIEEFINSLPMRYNTKIGTDGHGLSQGQRQRILIARAVYKNPDFLFFDEATNSLDTNNERQIMENMTKFFDGKTVVTIAHRLSTVKDADNIVVLNNGHIIEQGTHAELIELNGAYCNLVKNQLEIS